MSQQNPLFQNRTYRNRCARENLTPFQVTVKETNLAISAATDLSDLAVQAILDARAPLEAWMESHPKFATALSPVTINEPAPALVRSMAKAAAHASVGPMAAVAGAISEAVGRALLTASPEVIVENGGDSFLSVKGPVTVALYAGEASPFSMKVGLSFKALEHPLSICTSSGTLGHSLSFGKSDAVCVVSRSGALADAAATAIGNRVENGASIDPAIQFGKTIPGVEGLVVVAGSRIGFWGELDLVRI